MSVVQGLRPLIVAGASVRAFAASAARAGWAVHAADLFGDQDLRDVASSVVTIRPYPDGLPAALAGFPRAPVVYTGALENHPHLLAALGRVGPLAGCPPDRVARVRDPGSLGAVVRAAGLGFPETQSEPRGVPTDGSWLVKPRASAGGHGIHRWFGGEPQPAPGRVVWQRRVAGRSWSAGYLLAAGRARLLAFSRQLIGSRWCRAGPFAYSGSLAVDPASLVEPVGEQLRRLGGALEKEFGLVGLVGVDLVIDPQRRVHVIEVNPRPTASLELVEWATGLSLAAAHLAACGLAASPSEPRSWQGTWAKAVLYANRPLVCDKAVVATLFAEPPVSAAPAAWPAVADIPQAGQTVPAGGPVCTVYATAASATCVLGLVRRRLTKLAARLGV